MPAGTHVTYYLAKTGTPATRHHQLDERPPVGHLRIRAIGAIFGGDGPAFGQSGHGVAAACRRSFSMA
jgi:hypothetical protein